MLNLDFHHHNILVRCNESSLLQKIKDEFHFFATDASLSPATVIDIHLESPPPIPSLLAVKLLENCAVYRLGQRQYVDYFGEALTIWDESSDSVNIHTESKERAYELAFLAIHSLLGQRLDEKGLCRIHALAVSVNNVNGIVMLPSKGGKSTLLQNLIVNPEVKIISDDMPLCNLKGEIFPFPSKISLGEKPVSGVLSELTWHEFVRFHFPAKWTASLSQLKDRLAMNPEHNHNILVAGFRLSNGQSLLTEVPKWKMIGPMCEHMIFGIGLPQVIELFLKFNLTDIWKMLKHAAIRSVCAFNLVRNARCYHFYMGPDKSYNSQLLLDLIYEHQDT